MQESKDNTKTISVGDLVMIDDLGAFVRIPSQMYSCDNQKKIGIVLKDLGYIFDDIQDKCFVILVQGETREEFSNYLKKLN